jgi:biopolymer transport protein ExbD
MNFRSQHRRVGRIPRLPLVALIDVVLFLLMYFMLATDLGGSEKNLASALKTDSGTVGSSGKGSALRPQIIRVEATANGHLFRIGERELRDEKSLLAVLQILPKESGIVVRVSPDAKVESAAAALQACKDAGFVKVSYVPIGD